MNSNPYADIHSKYVPFSKSARDALQGKILGILNRLNDLDTRKTGMLAITGLAQNLDHRDIGILISCMLRIDKSQKPLCRAAYASLFGVLARLYGTKLQPHLTKVVSNLSKRCQDKDSRVQQACAEAFSRVVDSVFDSSGNVTLHQIFRPLFKVISRSEKWAQTGGALCLSAVIENSGQFLYNTLPKLCPRLMKCLLDRNSKAKVELLATCNVLIQVANTAITDYLAQICVVLMNSLRSKDWQTRNQGVLCFESIVLAYTRSENTPETKAILNNAKENLIPVLEQIKYDRIKSVRTKANQTLKLWEAASFDMIDNCSDYEAELQELEAAQESENFLYPRNPAQEDWFDPPADYPDESGPAQFGSAGETPSNNPPLKRNNGLSSTQPASQQLDCYTGEAIPCCHQDDLPFSPLGASNAKQRPAAAARTTNTKLRSPVGRKVVTIEHLQTQTILKQILAQQELMNTKISNVEERFDSRMSELERRIFKLERQTN